MNQQSPRRVSCPLAHGPVLHALIVGAGPPIVFVHGFPLNHQMWQHQWDAFAPNYLCIAPDLRGFGDSSVTPGVVTMAEFADDLAALLNELQVSEPVTLCGLSMGGYIAWQFWQRHADRLGRLVLCDTKASGDSEEVIRGRKLMAADVVQQGAQLAADRLLPRLFAPQTARGPIEACEAMIRGNDPVGIAAAQLGMAARTDMTEYLPQIDIPTLVVVGEHDQITPVSEMEKMASEMPQATFQVIPAAGHMAPWEQPEAVNQAIACFLDRNLR